jgi:pseudaminic acid biosynthesis-associated methylase
MNDGMTEQESFWQGSFGSDYINRNKDAKLLASNYAFFANILSNIDSAPKTCIEVGANIGMNILPLKTLLPYSEMTAVEINEDACEELEKTGCKVINSSILNFTTSKTFELVVVKGVLIHQNPDSLPATYRKLYSLASKWIIIAEYFSPNPVALPYRGHENKLFKRDFAGEILDTFPDLSLRSYGFSYKRDIFPQDDLTWFLLQKREFIDD